MSDQHRHCLERDGYNALLADYCELVDRVAAIEVRLNGMSEPEPGAWIEASQQLPPDDRDVLTFTNGYCCLHDLVGRAGARWGIAIGWYDHDRGLWQLRQAQPVTHWQFLPEPPSAAARMSGQDWLRQQLPDSTAPTH